MKMVIDNLDITGAEVVVRPDAAMIDQLKLDPKYKKDITVRIPNINMKGIGTGEGSQNGAAIKDVVSQVVGAMVAKAKESEDMPDFLKGDLNSALAAATDRLKGEVKEKIDEQIQKAKEKTGVDVTKTVDDLKKGNTQDLQKTGEDLLGRFGSKKDDKKPAPPATQPK